MLTQIARGLWELDLERHSHLKGVHRRLSDFRERQLVDLSVQSLSKRHDAISRRGVAREDDHVTLFGSPAVNPDSLDDGCLSIRHLQ